MKKLNIEILLMVIFLLVSIYIIYFNLFSKYSPISYILTHNMYLIVSILIYCLTNELIEIKPDKILLLFLLSLILIVCIFNVDNIILKHVIWLLLIISISLMGQNFYNYVKETYKIPVISLLLFVFFILIFIVGTLVKHNYIHYFNNNTNKILLSGLVGLILYKLIAIIFEIKEYKIVDLFGIILFSLFFISDNKKIIDKLDFINFKDELNNYIENPKFIKELSLYQVDDFVTANLSSFLDIINLFNNVINFSK